MTSSAKQCLSNTRNIKHASTNLTKALTKIFLITRKIIIVLYVFLMHVHTLKSDVCLEGINIGIFSALKWVTFLIITNVINLPGM